MKKINILLIAIMLLALTSCLKHDVYIQEPSQSSSVIMIAKTGDPISSVTASLYSGYSADLGVVETGDTVGFNINVVYGGTGDAPNDIVVNLGLDTAKLRLYNTQNGTSYILPTNTAMYTFPSSVTIKKGTRLAQGRAVITITSDFDYTKAYALPITISSVSSGTISSNGGTAIYYCPARNEYDGIYAVSSGTVTRFTSPGVPANDALSGSMVGNPNMTLVTTGPNTVELQNMKWHGGASGVAGIDNLRATIDPSTNNVTMTSLGNTTLKNIDGAVNKYDPTTRTFTLNFIWNPTGASRTITNLVLVYKNAR